MYSYNDYTGILFQKISYKMSLVLQSSFTKLPNEIISNILSYDGRINYRNGTFIDRIPLDDVRYSILQKRWKKTTVHLLGDCGFLNFYIYFHNKELYLSKMIYEDYYTYHFVRRTTREIVYRNIFHRDIFGPINEIDQLHWWNGVLI